MVLIGDEAPRRILVADDDPVIRNLISVVARREGYAVVVANDGREAYRILQRDADFRAAIFDMVMPHLEGIDITRYMRTEKRLMRIPVMMMAAKQDHGLLKDSFTAGVTMFLPKPFTTEQLQTSLRILLLSGNGTHKASTMRGQAHV